MNPTGRQAAVEGARAATAIIGALTVIAGLTWTFIKPSAEDFIDATVESKLETLEERIDSLDTTGRALSTQQAVQQQQTEFLIRQSNDSSDDIKEIQRDIKSLLRTLNQN
jgi:hypothetical protein